MMETFLLTLFHQSQPRRARVLYGLLRNQMTVSTNYHGLRYDLLYLINIWPKLSREKYNQAINRLVQTQYIQEIAPGQFIRTSLGQQMMLSQQSKHYTLQNKHELFVADVIGFREVFLLANQVVSESAYHNSTYYPLPSSLLTQQLVKRWYQQNRSTDMGVTWVDALQTFLQTRLESDADNLVASWPGHQIPGRVFEQLNFDENWSRLDYRLWELDQYAALSHFLRESKLSPLKALWLPFSQRQLMSQSMQQTYQEFMQGASIELIVRNRGLKVSTVREHLLSAAIMVPLKAFDYLRFYDKKTYQWLNDNLQGSIDNWNYEAVHQQNASLDFFQFRLYCIQQTKVDR
ncbi:helix-turn-helix domain-containing protein [Weissella diestrammenae]|uniref:Helix-turn-helix domain-containing protein n=1 Tax=Weissella diestrammenae TaxID=1162633 RepID=A0A7G9T5Q4_9LACO|nr:helix-turn-helix domain-containing protein [Weissella diestrammenae]MCM0582255.1 helix-turn-helix domain-containing protein [Weissella diestrammenae]QNN75429.1 helix-turn-helix domain-containing protein [Weissella diestrammenae]